MNRPRVGQRIGSQRSGCDGLIDVPLGVHRFDGLILHPCGKAFVQPDVIPPLHRDQIAKPLMRHLVRDHAGDSLLQADRPLLLVDQKNHLAECDAASILHCARREIWQADQVQLSIGILDSEILVVVAEDILGGFEGELAHVLLAGRAVHANRNPIGLPLDVFKVAHDQGREVGRHFGGGGEANRVFVARTRSVRDDFLVRDRDQALVGHRRNIEGRFIVGFVERRESAPRVGGFKL